MIVNFDCQFCGRGQAAPASKAGRTVPCRYCGGDCEVPRAEGAPTLAPPPPAPGVGQAIGTPVGGGPEKTTFHPPPQGDPFRPSPARPPSGRQGQGPYSAPQAELHRRPPLQQTSAIPEDVNNAATAAIVLAALGWAICPFTQPFALWQGMRSKSLAARYGVKAPAHATIAIVLAAIQLFGIVAWIGLVILMGVFGGLQ